MSTQVIDKAYIDCDPIAYAGACAVEKASYTWEKNDGSEKSETFKTAKEAKDYKELGELQGEDFDNEWTRHVGVRYGTEKEAEEGCDGVVKDYVNTAKILAKNVDIEPTGYFTSSDAPKTKDIKGLEHRYQGNRDPSKKPKLLKHCREYLMKKYPWMIMAQVGFEADTHIVALCEKHGDSAVGLFIDKDLAQMEEGQFIDMKRPKGLRVITKSTEIGALWVETNARGVESIKGHGFMWLVFQAVVGDPADGYYGFSGLGQKTVYPLLKDCDSKRACVQAMYDVYLTKLTKGVLSKKAKELGAKPIPNHICYLSWDGKRVKLNARDLLQQHLFLAYQERGATDEISIGDYLD